ncbi:hypothetical protein EDD86DRAFT_275602 [Gorgonomyces haynaldii]|nr:hypothetical protein EDD86DRAFT_275602 [Gorgonomyces haynaldii]
MNLSHVAKQVSGFHASLDMIPAPTTPKSIRVMNDCVYYISRIHQKSALMCAHLSGKIEMVAGEQVQSVEGLIDYQLEGATLLVQLKNGLVGGSLKRLMEIPPNGQRSDPKLSPRHPLFSFVRQGNLFICDFKGRETQLTHTAIVGLNNGISDYIMQEEFKRYTGYYWQDSEECRLVYMQTDETFIPVHQLGMTGTRYPRVGTQNALVRLCVVQFQYNQRTEAIFEIENMFLHPYFDLYILFPWLEYIPRFGFLPDGSVWAQLLDREQKRTALIQIPLSLFSTKQASESIRIIFEQVTDGWINVSNAFQFISSSLEHVELIWSHEHTGYRHLYHIISHHLDGPSVSRMKSKQEQLTFGEWTMRDDPIYVDSEHKLVYFMAHKDTCLESHLYVVSYVTKDIKRLTPLGRSHKITMNSDRTLFVSVWSNLTTPYQTQLFTIKFDQSTDHKRPRLESLPRSILTTKIGSNVVQKYAHLPKPDLFSFFNSRAVEIHCMLFKPPNFKEDSCYPVLVNIYGGPSVQMVCNDFKYPRLYQVWLACSLGFIVLMVDSTGSYGRGQQFELPIQQKLGSVELQDQVEALLHLITFGQTPAQDNMEALWTSVRDEWQQGFHCRYMDMDRICLLGWSYGGYLSLLGIVHYPYVFKMVVAGAPVTKWELYDTAYTERYLGVLPGNKSVYQRANILDKANQFPDAPNRVLLAHGLLDDNVHYDHTRLLVKELEDKNKPFLLQMYPDEKHGIRGRHNCEHFETTVFSWLLEHLSWKSLRMTSFLSTANIPTVANRPQIDMNLRLMCPRCKNPTPNIVEDFKAGDLICGDCGVVLGNRIIDTRSEWRTFANSDDSSGDPSRVGAAQDPLLDAKLIDSTTISGLDGGSGKARDLARAHQRVVHTRGDENIMAAFRSIQHMGEQISLTRPVIDSAKQLFKRVEDDKLLKGKSPEAVQAVCIYIACRENGVTRTYREICQLTRVPKKEIGRCFKLLQPFFEANTAINFDAYITRFGSQLDIPGYVVNRVSEKGILDGKSPISIVAASLYMVSCLSNDPQSAKSIAEVAGCTEATLKNAYRIMFPHANEFLDDLELPLPVASLVP